MMVASSPAAKPRILYVDDEPDNLRSFRALFRRDYDIHVADSAPAALQVLRQETIDVLVSDQRMPGMTGVELLERVAAEFPEILRFMLTGFSDYDPLVDAINNGRIQGYFSKPLNPDEIKDRIGKGLENLHLKVRNEQLFEELKISEERFRTLFEQAADSIVLIDPDTGMLHDFNAMTYTNLGYSREDLQQIKLHELAVEGFREEMRNHLEEVMKTGAHTFAMQLSGKDGGLHDFLMKLKAVSIHGRTYILGILDDITDQMKVQAELKQSQGFLHAIVENIPDMIVVQDINDLRFIKFNKAGEELLGYSREELLGKSVYDLFPEDQANFYTRKDREVLNRREGVDIPEETVKTRHKGQRILSTRKIPILDDAGQPQYLLGVSEDITEKVGLKQKEKKLETQLRQLHKMEAIGTLAGGIAHDFNNILSPIFGYTEIVLTRLDKTSKNYENLCAVLSAAQRAKDLVKQILTFSRKSELELKPLLLQPLIKESVKFLRSSLPSTIEIRRHIDEHCGPIMADPTQMQQVLMNLCTNAYHSMHDHGGILELTLNQVVLSPMDLDQFSGIEAGRYLRLGVRDTGAGMTEEVLDRIFEPYFTTKEKGDGTGLGLSVVHGIVTSYGGSIKISSEIGKGTMFNIFLPVVQVSPLPEKNHILPPLSEGKERILLVDDEQQIVNMMKEMLEYLGYSVAAFTDSHEALEYFAEYPLDFELIISDLTMPKLTGPELARKLLEIREDAKILICTGFSESLPKEKVEALGIKGMAMKPITMWDLATAVRSLLDGKSLLG
jgi:PAS domain S-box-containing protein